MRLRQRINKLGRFMPGKSEEKEVKELKPKMLWLINNDEEFRECLKQLWRLKMKAEQDSYQWDRLPEPYQKQAEIIQARMNHIYEKTQL